ncbi:MAG: phosphatidate cytidylyltransferase [Magnetococcales bacterium]|nr:phosphatidate cytidylyltransferase [Magnetococcales bacterium]
MIVRIASALVLAPLALLLLFRGTPFSICVFLSLLVVGLLFEWHRFRPPVALVDYALSVGLGWALIVAQCAGHATWIPALLTGGIALFAGMATWRFSARNGVLDRTSFLFFGLLYCVMPLVLMVQIHALANGPSLLGLLLLVIWGTDIGAFFAGRTFGKKKLAPRLSPGKTWAGLYGGVGAGILAAWAAIFLFPLDIGPGHAILLGLVLSLAGQLGDLAESMVKREAGIKDSGSIIPGHGGLLDRLDSLLFAVPVLCLYVFGVTLLGR